MQIQYLDRVQSHNSIKLILIKGMFSGRNICSYTFPLISLIPRQRREKRIIRPKSISPSHYPNYSPDLLEKGGWREGKVPEHNSIRAN